MLLDTDLASGVIRSPYSFDIPHAFIFNESEFLEPIYCGPYAFLVNGEAKINNWLSKARKEKLGKLLIKIVTHISPLSPQTQR